MVKPTQAERGKLENGRAISLDGPLTPRLSHWNTAYLLRHITEIGADIAEFTRRYETLKPPRVFDKDSVIAFDQQREKLARVMRAVIQVRRRDLASGPTRLPGDSDFLDGLNDIRKSLTHLLFQADTFRTNPSLEPTPQRLRRAHSELLAQVTEGSIPLDLLRRISIENYACDRQEPSNHLFSEISQICKDLTINTSVMKPQRGFGRALSPEELYKTFNRPGGQLTLLRLDGAPVGFFVLSTIESQFSESASAARAIWQRKFGPEGQAAWGEVVGVSDFGREEFRRHKVNAYELLLAVGAMTAHTEGARWLLGSVREGAQANLAKSSHLRVGWMETGISVGNAAPPAQLLALSLTERNIPFFGGLSEVAKSCERRTSVTFPTVESLFKNLEFRPGKEVSVYVGRDPEALAKEAERLLREHSLEGTAQALPCVDGTVIQLNLGMFIAFRQLVPEVDLWEWEDLSPFPPCGAFREVFDRAMSDENWLKKIIEKRRIKNRTG
jgi:hypothetical protein